jgi:cytochrome P450
MFDLDPYPMFAEMRRTNPVAHVAMMNRRYVLTRYDDVWSVLRDGDTYSSRQCEVASSWAVIEMDGRSTRAIAP